MTTTTILAAIGALTLILHTASRIPAALADFLRACLPLLRVINDLRAALSRPHPQTDNALPPADDSLPDNDCPEQ
ncbi:hypothetical protein ACFFMN_06485 [Planobispora siamensis]|nr:hypothetical protein [Planobispora siamensis]